MIFHFWLIDSVYITLKEKNYKPVIYKYNLYLSIPFQTFYDGDNKLLYQE